MSAADLVPKEPAPWASYERLRAAGKIPYQHCDSCEQAVFYPRVLCPHCGSIDLAWRESEGVGEIYSQSFLPDRQGGGRHVLLVDLDEGFRLMGSAADDSAEMPIGSRVAGVVEMGGEENAQPRFVFTKEEAR